MQPDTRTEARTILAALGMLLLLGSYTLLAGTTGKIAGWGKESAHTICIPCHDLDDKGPVECHQCHKK